VLSQASFPRRLLWLARLHTLLQLTLKQKIIDPEGVSTEAGLAALQQGTSTQTSSKPSLDIVPGEAAQRPFVVKG
jgi:hypothetical protein